MTDATEVFAEIALNISKYCYFELINKTVGLFFLLNRKKDKEEQKGCNTCF